MDGLRGGNLALAFALELAMLVAFALAGWALAEALWVKAGLAVAVPAVAIGLWGLWAAPRALRRLKMPGLGLFKAVMLGAGVGAFLIAGQPFVAAVYGTLVVVNFLGMWAFGQW